jgi:neutral ceramidase
MLEMRIDAGAGEAGRPDAGAIVLAGAAVVDITPPPGLTMAGYAARTSPATGMHDPLTVRALVVGDTALVSVDVIGLHEDTCGRIRARVPLADDHVVVTALHTHGGPRAVPGRVGGAPEAGYVTHLEDACVAAIEAALANRRPARLSFGNGADPEVAQNRRHDGGVTDPQLPVLRIRGEDGGWIAVVLSYACHPVVLGADNTLWTADYPGAVRDAVEAAHPGAVALFLTGCAGDAGIGDTPHGSISTAPSDFRSFANAERLGRRIGAAALAAPQAPLPGLAQAISAPVALDLVRPEEAELDTLGAQWRADSQTAEPAWAALYESWADWADTAAREPLAPCPLRVTVFDWGGVRLVALPGEIFAATARQIRQAIDGAPVGGRSFVFCFADGVPGYIPPAEEYAFGGYEVDEAHRYYGMPGAFAQGSAERLVQTAATLAATLAGGAADIEKRA